MGLFTPDLYRNFAIGFAVGTLIVLGQLTVGDWQTAVPQAFAQDNPAATAP